MHHRKHFGVNNCYHRCSYYCWYHSELRDGVYAEFINNDPTATGKLYWNKKKITSSKTTGKDDQFKNCAHYVCKINCIQHGATRQYHFGNQQAPIQGISANGITHIAKVHDYHVCHLLMLGLVLFIPYTILYIWYIYSINFI